MLEFDVVIVGAGVAGLWTACRLAARGVSVLVLEQRAMGGGQTIASQGIIHGGIKYALTGQASRASAAIAQMPEQWSACLQGRGDIDLRATRTLSPCQYLWTTPGVISRIAGLGASKAIRTPVERVDPDDRPPLLRDAPRGVAGLGAVDVYKVAEPVLDAHSTITALVAQAASRGVVFASVGPDAPSVVDGAAGAGLILSINHADGAPPTPSASHDRPRVHAGAVVLAAGEHNEPIARRLNIIGPDERIMQLRPLHMVLARNVPGGESDSGTSGLFGHCLGGGATTTPRITITSFSATAQSLPRPTTGWYIGGEIAESGVNRSEHEQKQAARNELAACLKWLDLSRLELATHRVNRAEGLTSDGARPDEPVVRSFAAAPRVIVGWPTKLAFAPEFASRVEAALEQSGALKPPAGRARAGPPTQAELQAMGFHAPPVARPVWESHDARSPATCGPERREVQWS